MKLTTARLKKLIREEFNRINESTAEQKKEIFNILQKIAANNNIPDPKRSKLAKIVSHELVDYLFKTAPGYYGDKPDASKLMNFDKHSTKFRGRQPSNRKEDIYQIIVNSVKNLKFPHSVAEKLAKITTPAILNSKSFKENSEDPAPEEK
tara:strand:- start:903 stop:1352 length:450 start_codon:yes stop_codon:yes gene_type:complete